MGESDEKEKPQNQADTPPVPTTTEAPDQTEAEARLDHARRFLRDGEVRLSSTEKKTEFLKEKGFTDTEIQTLLAEDDAAGQPDSSSTSPATSSASGSSSTTSRDVKEDEDFGRQQQEKEDKGAEKRAPIVTYPEFLAKPARPPPLITPTRFLNTLYGFAGLATAVYGASQYVVAPMVASTTDARIELHETALKGLSGLVAKLESVVSEIPPAISHPQPPKTGSSTAKQRGGASTNDDDDASSCDDPTEMFHRDVGVQTTSPPPSPPSRLKSQDAAEQGSTVDAQAARLGSLTRSLQTVRQDFASESEDYDDLKTVLGVTKTYLDGLTYPARIASFAGNGYPYNPYGVSSSTSEPDDEVKRVKENIRSVKGILLSARSFPAGSR